MQLQEVKGIGPKTLSLLEKLSIYTINDLVSFYPYKYNIYKFNNALINNENNIIPVIVESIPVVRYIKRNFNKLSFRGNFNNQVINIDIFNRAFLKPNIQIGKQVVLIGKYDCKKNLFVASDIKFNIKSGDIESVYHLTKGLNNNNLSKLINSVINYQDINDFIPNIYNEKYHFLDKNTAIKHIHFPQNTKEIQDAKIRLIYEELFDFSFKMNYLKNQNQFVLGTSKSIDNKQINDFISSLPFTLTDDQQKTIDEIIKDMQSTKMMNRLVLGDVGSGKTIVATTAIYANFIAGFQSAFMVPTEILANQHYESLQKVLMNYHVNVALITGSMTKTNKQKIYDKVKSGEINLIIGTHSLLNEELSFNNLGLVITDEQHRFGVNQRSILQNKTEKPDVLYLSATPIPRTYAMTIYGDMDISIIKTKPNGRKPIITKIKKESEIRDVLMSMLDEIKQGHQVYVVSPLVEQNEELDLSSVKKLKEKLDLAFQNKISIEIIHGKMKAKEKDSIMQKFKENKIKILISTTVIEVGVDVPNATEMVVFNAERFGLATLHQLRGRIGRNQLQSYCYLISDSEKERLEVMEESNDGFYISQKDFELRGHGDLFGTRQSGDMNFKIANLNNDYQILLQTQKDTEEYINSKGYLDNNYYSSLADSLNIVD